MANIRRNIRTGRSLRKKTLPVAVAVLTAAAPALASQPIWQPALYCAALDLTRAEMLRGLATDDADGDAADLLGRTYLRIAAEGLGCPAEAQLRAMLTTARIGIGHRIDLAAQYGHGPDVMVRAMASESTLVCAGHFDPELVATARAAEQQSPPAACAPAN